MSTFDVTVWDSKADFRGWPADRRSFFSPRDAFVHEVILTAVQSARLSIKVNMYGYDDDDIDKALHGKAALDGFVFQMNLDKSQSAGVHEKALVQPWASSVGTSVAVGQSQDHAISHLKVAVIDGLITISGSTNWSLSGEEKQDNELVVTVNPDVARRYSTILDLNHTEMLRQMG